MKTTQTAWALKWIADNKLDGYREHLNGRVFLGSAPLPPECGGYAPMLFQTKREAQELCRKQYGYIAKRNDLRVEPHCWRMPKVIRVNVTIEEIQ
ncbi:MAG: hypothetical protein ACREC4_00835 [Methylocella sp.]